MILLVVLTLSASAQQNPSLGKLDKSVVGAWDASDGSFRDWSQYTNNAVLHGNVPITNNGCYYFDGTTANYLSVADSPSLYSTNFTVCAWINAQEITDLVPSRDPVIAAKDNTGAREWHFYVKQSGSILGVDIFKANGTPTVVNGIVTLGSNVWYHACFSYLFVADGNSQCTLWLNGITNAAATNFGGPMADTATEIEIGRRSFSTFEDSWAGFINDVYIFNRVLLAEEIKQLYELGKPRHQ